MQIRDYEDICLKSTIETDNNINTLKEELAGYFSNLLQEVLKLYKAEDTIYEYQVEQIVNDSLNIYETILSNNIHDYYLQVSETSQEKVDNAYKSAQVKKVYNHLRKQADKNILDEIIPYEEILDEYDISKEIRQAINRYRGNQLAQQLNQYRIPLDRTHFTPTELFEFEVDQAVIEYMSKEIFVASPSTMERVTQEIYEIIKQSYGEEGHGIGDVTRDILDKFDKLADYEAERIARTETLKAQGSANYQRLLNDPNVEYKQWIATDDERTRDSHSEQNEQITYVDGTFANGCQYDGDTNADIEEWINCRCDTVAYLPDPGMVAPPGAEYWFEDDMVVDLNVERFDWMVESPEFIPSYW